MLEGRLRDAGNRSASDAGSYIDRYGSTQLCGPAAFLPKTPLMGLHYPEAEEQIGYGVGENARN